MPIRQTIFNWSIASVASRYVAARQLLVVTQVATVDAVMQVAMVDAIAAVTADAISALA